MEGAAATLLLHPGAQWAGSSSRAAKSCLWQLLGPQREILTVPLPWEERRRHSRAWPGEPSLSRQSFSGSVCGWLPAGA